MSEQPTDEKVREQTRQLVERLGIYHPEQECEPIGLRLPDDYKPDNNPTKAENETQRKRRLRALAMRQDADQKALREKIKGDTARSIIMAVATRHGVLVDEMLSGKRFRPLVRARQDAYVALQDGGFHISAIGRIINKDHSSVLYGIRKARAANVSIPQ